MSSLVERSRQFIDRRLTRSYIQTICILFLLAFLTALIVSFLGGKRGRTVFGPFLGADFGSLYVAGKIYDTHSPDRIYDAGLHQQLYREAFPDAPPDSQLPYANAPFFILPLALLARLPYSWAFLTWLLLSVCLYIAGFSLVWRVLNAIPKDAWLTSLLLAVSFMPFLAECLAGGQTSAWGFFFLALAINGERRNQVLSGAALSLCSYKPTLLLLIVPMLLVSRRFMTFLGFIIGNGLLIVASLLAVGWQGCIGYLKALLYFTNASTSVALGLRSWKYVDVNSFFRLLLVNHANLRWVMTVSAFLLVVPLLIKAWYRPEPEGANGPARIWALTLTWTPVLNLYMGIYDSCLLVLAALLASDLFLRTARGDKPTLAPAQKYILLLLYITPWITQPLARATGLQIYTLVIALFGYYQILERQRSQVPQSRYSN